MHVLQTLLLQQVLIEIYHLRHFVVELLAKVVLFLSDENCHYSLDFVRKIWVFVSGLLPRELFDEVSLRLSDRRPCHIFLIHL